ncbi:bifunctional protein-serine/threonine kinase/phosphatase [Echinimonas agarilytica]|uniref:Bifunctional protein-serine/threonine kinase/phosphatase n=1 Tax=Echinimonas agarilytica TaxID=1215918 RepID=A0AA41W9P0_9GAMM|nr:bifunctional protein-serine/threonine kinase/phosphatase [Echinimonas agarilytica]MCM2681375.1 bifunctional protein-serine/threonine kinase/phosphatase [Echinimonas agarilytica]
MKQLSMTVGGFSTAGVKAINQDAFAAKVPAQHISSRKGIVAAVADGVSVSDQSQVASQTAVTQFIQDYLNTKASWSVGKSAAAVLSPLNQWFFSHNQRHERSQAYVTTFTSFIAKGRNGWFFHAGDSRLYRIRAGKAQCLTRDHIQPFGGHEALSRALGIDSHLELDTQQFSLEEGDFYLLVTDGFYRYLDTQDYLSELLLEQGNNLEEFAQTLCERAQKNGSDDNISCLILRVDEVPEAGMTEARQAAQEGVIPPVMKPGQKIDGLTVKHILFSGTRSHVYVVENKDEEQFVLKAPSAHFAGDMSYLEGFVKEEWIGKMLNYPNIMRIFDRPQKSPFIYHLCEYLPGQNLRQWMVDNPKPSLNQVRDIIRETTKAVRAFQRNDMLHRDLKPENIIINTNGHVKIIDFGTVQASGLEEHEGHEKHAAPQGSADYIAPEYLLNQSATFKSDMFSLAVVMYEMLAGALPFKTGASRYQIPNDIGAWNYRPLRQLRPDLPKWIDLSLERACSPVADIRPDSYSEFLQDLNHPNPELLDQHEAAPLMKRDPVLFWKSLSGILAVICMGLLLKDFWH